MHKKIFKSFFKVHSENVDNAETLGFWKLTDTILETFLLENMKKRRNIILADFGGGTGRWLKKLDDYFNDSKFILVDLSEDMLAKAKEKIEKGLYKNEILTIKSDIVSVKQIESESVDYIISTYNPLSFCNQPQAVINEAYRILKPGGCAMITVQGYHNALYSKINNFLAPSKEISEIFLKKKVRWTPAVPALWQLTKEDMELMFKKSGFKHIIKNFLKHYYA
jgi:ubiquinone/menaquinone biosynthesis C-methylase UbiE